MSACFNSFISSLFLPSANTTNVRISALHQSIRDSDRGGFTTPDRQQAHLSFHDMGLRGPSGANIVLRALADNPFAHKLTLSHNRLGDQGIQQLSTRANAQIRELNLASNEISDIGFSALLRHWPQPRLRNCHCESVSLTELYLSNNQITLKSLPSPLLFIKSLTVLSLTSNPIDPPSLIALFRNPAFSPQALKTLHLSACSLDVSLAFALAGWLEDPDRAGRLEWLAVNGNNWGTLGCERIVWALARPKGNKNLLKVEMLACDKDQPLLSPEAATAERKGIDQVESMPEFGTEEERARCRTLIDSEGGWKILLERCELRNQVFRLCTRRAALGIIAASRLTLISKPGPKKNDTGCGWNKLPEEIQFEIWRWVGLLSAFPGLQHCYSSTSSPPASPSGGLKNVQQPNPGLQIPEPLTVIQLSHVLSYAADRRTLFEEISARRKFVLEKSAKRPSTRTRSGEVQRMWVEADRAGQELALLACKAQRFEGRI